MKVMSYTMDREVEIPDEFGLSETSAFHLVNESPYSARELGKTRRQLEVLFERETGTTAPKFLAAKLPELSEEFKACLRAQRKEPGHREKMIAMAAELSNIQVLEDLGSTAKVKCRGCGVEWTMAIDHVRAAKGCNSCSTARATQAKTVTLDEFLKTMPEGVMDRWTISGYQASSKPCKFTCVTCGNSKSTTPHHFRDFFDHKCSWCSGRASSSLGELLIESLLRGDYVSYEREWTIPGTRRRFDFYLPEHKLAIEYDGPHHSSLGEWWGDRGGEEQEISDRIKEEFASEKGIRVIHLSYRSRNNLDLVREDLESLGLSLSGKSNPPHHPISQAVERYKKEGYETITADLDITRQTLDKWWLALICKTRTDWLRDQLDQCCIDANFDHKMAGDIFFERTGQIRKRGAIYQAIARVRNGGTDNESGGA